ncbi:MAG: hypothetical protein GY909_15495 [Oligoflexia bacterium]|nr:hypothetical protein [Oligoflexia bacterium]
MLEIKKKKALDYVGIDLSTKNTGVSILSSKNLYLTFHIKTRSFKKSPFWVIIKKSYCPKSGSVVDEKEIYSTKDQEKIPHKQLLRSIQAKMLASVIYQEIKNLNLSYIGIEEYSYNSSGATLMILVEFGTIFKNELSRLSGKLFLRVSPDVIKKYATGIANADKEVMKRSLKMQSKLDISSNDLVDAIYLSRFVKTIHSKINLCTNDELLVLKKYQDYI